MNGLMINGKRTPERIIDATLRKAAANKDPSVQDIVLQAEIEEELAANGIHRSHAREIALKFFSDPEYMSRGGLSQGQEISFGGVMIATGVAVGLVGRFLVREDIVGYYLVCAGEVLAGLYMIIHGSVPRR